MRATSLLLLAPLLAAGAASAQTTAAPWIRLTTPRFAISAELPAGQAAAPATVKGTAVALEFPGDEVRPRPRAR